jgi:hypothetical protein
MRYSNPSTSQRARYSRPAHRVLDADHCQLLREFIPARTPLPVAAGSLLYEAIGPDGPSR